MRDIAFFGGAFDPPHLGHLAVIEFLNQWSLSDEVWVVPAFSHPFEKTMAPYEHRQAMCQRLIADFSSKVRVSSIEKQLGTQPTYTLEVIRLAKKQNPGARFWLVLGTDCFRSLPQWHKYQQLKNEVNFLFLPRPGFADSPFPDVTSTRVRQLLKKGASCEKLLTPEVFSYLVAKRLYATKKI